MGKFVSGFVLPLLLLTAALLNWSLISLVDLLAFLFIQYAAPKFGSRFQRQSLLAWYTLIFSLLSILSYAIFYTVWVVKGDQWSIYDAQWAKLIGFQRDLSWSFPSVIYFLLVQGLAALVALFEIYCTRFGIAPQKDSFWGHLYSYFLHIGSRLRVLCCLLLPAVQLVRISHPSWASLPFFLCSTIGLVDWSLTSNFLGLFRSWRYLLLYAGLNIVLLYLYQLPIEYSGIFKCLADFIGLYKISAMSEWSEICSGLFLLVFYMIVIFFLMVLDHIIYLCSFATRKVIFYLFTLLLFTYSITSYAWHMEPSDRHAGKFALRAIYLMKLISLVLQAMQIRFGIPHESNFYRQFLTSSISQSNFLGFRIYRALPFLYELRCVLDWSCTTTSLTMYDWLKVACNL